MCPFWGSPCPPHMLCTTLNMGKRETKHRVQVVEFCGSDLLYMQRRTFTNFLPIRIFRFGFLSTLHAIMWPPGLPHGILCTRLQYVHIEAWYTGSFGVARIPAGYVPKNQNLKKLSGNRSEKGLKCVQKENGPQKSHKQCMKHTSLIQQKPLIYSFLTLYV